ncbi:MAG: PAS domain S-box protein [Treponema sp.]|nr:PAS domain S-box protein [Treponema sp.]
MDYKAEEYRLIFEHAPIGLLSFDDNGVIQTCNNRFVEIIGSSKEKLIGLNMLALPDSKLVQVLKKALEGGSGYYEGLYHAVTSGKIIPVRALFAAKFNDERQFSCGIGIIEDISEQYYTAQALRDSEEKFRLVFSHSTDGLLIADSEGRVTDWNKAYETITGISAEEARGKYLWDLQYECALPELKSQDVLLKLKQMIKTALSTGTGDFLNRPIEMEMVSRSGQRLSIENVGFIIPSSKGNFFGGRLVDITARKTAEAKIKALLEEKSLILKEVHHRIKNNMASVISLLTLQAETMKDPVAKDALLTAAGRVHSMMLLYEKLYTGDVVGSVKAADYIPALVQDILENTEVSINITPHISVEDVELEVKTLQSLGIIINELITNAIKYAFPALQEGTISIDFRKVEDTYVLVVADDGCGISSEQVRTGPASEDRYREGFGLTLVRLMAEQLYGTLDISSDHGTRVTLRFKG